jgi:hypothetical protein
VALYGLYEVLNSRYPTNPWLEDLEYEKAQQDCIVSLAVYQLDKWIERICDAR